MARSRSVRPRGRLLVWLTVLTSLLVACSPVLPPRAVERAAPGLLRQPPAPSAAIAPGLRVVPGPIPFPFEENRGQAPDDVAYVLRTGPMSVGFTNSGPRFRLVDAPRCDARAPLADPTGGTSVGQSSDLSSCSELARGHALTLELGGAAGQRPIGAVPSETLVSHFRGKPDEWLVGVPAFHQITYPDAWPGIDVRYERAGAALESSYVIAPGADPSSIRLVWHGADGARLGEDGGLTLTTPVGTLHESAPIAWQDGPAGERIPVPVRFDLLGDGADGAPIEVGLRLGAYDPSQSLTIDPFLTYSGYLGGGALDSANGIAVDSAGAAYVVGHTQSNDFPTQGTLDTALATAPDAFVAKLSADGTTLVYAGYIGGGVDDIATGVAVDSSGAAYVVGYTSSTQANFPLVGTLDNTYNSNGGTPYDAFVTKVAPNGNSLTYSGYIGGEARDRGYGIALDSTGAAYVVGDTDSAPSSFPDFSVGARLLTEYGGTDVFVAKVATDGNSLAYCGYIAGQGDEYPTAIAVDSSGAAYVVGRTGSTHTSFPVEDGPRITKGADYDAFISKVLPDASDFAYSGFIGGTQNEWPFGVAVDSTGAAYVVGETNSNNTTHNFPVTGTLDDSYNGGVDAFIAKVAVNGTSLVYAGYIGGNQAERATGVAVDITGAAYVVGFTESTSNFPLVGNLDNSHNGGTQDAFVAKVASNGNSLVYSGYLGGSGDETAMGIAVDSMGQAYVAGQTSSTTPGTPFPNAGGSDSTYGGNVDGFVTKVGDTPPPTTATLTINSGAAATNSPNVTLTLSNVVAPGGVAQMAFSNDNVTYSAWEPFNATKSWTLAAGPDGTRTVYEKVRDALNNESGPFTDTIILDTTLPALSDLTINGGALTTTSTTVNLAITASDATSGLSEMSFSNDGSTWGAWQAFATTASWTATAGNGEKTVFARLKDGAGNISASKSDTITLDTTVQAEFSVSINDAADFTRSVDVTLTIGARPGTAKMQVSNDGGFAGAPIEPYVSRKPWRISRYSGAVVTSIVYVRFLDQNNQVILGSQVDDFIYLDDTPPTGTVQVQPVTTSPPSSPGLPPTTPSTRTVTVVAQDLAPNGGQPSGVKSVVISSRADFVGAQTFAYNGPLTANVNTEGDGTIYVKIIDNAGNISDSLIKSNCGTGPRPKIGLQTARENGELRVTLTAGAGAIQYIQLGPPGRPLRNVEYRVNLGSGATWRQDNTTLAIPSPTQTYTFYIRRILPGETATVQIRVWDDCGPWDTFFGGGPGTF